MLIAVGKAVHAVVPSEAKALALIGIVAAAFGIVAIGAFARRLFGPADRVGILAPLFAATAPLYWFTAARPLSDSFGLAAAIGVQALILAARSERAILVVAFLTGVAAGIRSQVLWLTVPLLVATVGRDGREGQEGQAGQVGQVGRAGQVGLAGRVGRVGRGALVAQGFSPASVTAAFAIGIALWFVPLVLLSGGPAAYWHALFDQGAEDLSGITMLWTQPNVRTLIAALYYGFVAPWAVWPFALVLLALAVAGAMVLARGRWSVLKVLAIAFGPYLAFDVLFQETFTVRYALPLVVPLAILAAAAISAMPAALAVAAAVPIAMFGAHVGGRSIADYARQPAPVFRLLDDMRRAGQRAVLAPDRRASFDLRRPLKWLGGTAPAFDRQLPSPPQHEWLEAVNYWNAGGRAPVWFVVDPKRTSIQLIQHGEPIAYRYALPYPALMSGTRPADADWYRIDRPEWYVADGWALTPEAAGVSAVDRRGLAFGAIEGRIASSAVSGGTLVLGGRNFEPTLRSRIVVDVAGVWHQTFTAEPGAFLHVWRVPRIEPDSAAADYAPLSIAAEPPANVAVEQFDASAARPLLGFGSGWHERELNPTSGVQWRWISARGEIRYVSPKGPSVLVIAGESPLKYYSKPSRIVVRAGATVLRDVTVSSDFSIVVNVPAATEPSTIVVETDQTHVPAERRSWRRVTDRRQLGLKIYSCAFVDATASGPGTTTSFQPAR